MPSLRLWFLMVLPFALWGTAMTAMAPLIESTGPWLIAGLRLLPAGLALLLWGQRTGRGLMIDSRDLVWFLLFTLVDATLFQGLLARGMEGTGAGLGSVLIDCQPLLVALMARVFFLESINPIGWMGLAIGLVGIVCIGLPAELLEHWWFLADPPVVQQLFQPGEGLMLLAAVAMAAGTVLIRFASRHSDPVTVTAWHMVLGGLPLLLVHAQQGGDAALTWTAMDWARMVYVSLLGSALAYGLFFWFANQRDLTSFSSLGFLTPVFALATGGWLLGERLDLLQWIGVVLVLVSVIFVSQRRRFWEPLPITEASS
ncbi:membrane protein [Synechococcus sp. KORDI-52]|uniref:DMT family transporter n=1 Tax=Synechococcus sp. KORDI-52 TaxID=585425 RepID=UPI0004E06794|nr:DMT family transporter [Synechococcus sp. KORDI-52]AII50252.1 membrane protein [Synechococcus sp. KORDI-52]